MSFHPESGTYQLRDHFPFSSISLLAESVPVSRFSEDTGTQSVGEEVTINGKRRKVSFESDGTGNVWRGRVSHLDKHGFRLNKPLS
jgi:hypothetical protein